MGNSVTYIIDLNEYIITKSQHVHILNAKWCVIGAGTLLSQHRGGQQIVPGGVMARDAGLHVDTWQLFGHVAGQGAAFVQIDAISRHPEMGKEFVM